MIGIGINSRITRLSNRVERNRGCVSSSRCSQKIGKVFGRRVKLIRDYRVMRGAGAHNRVPTDEIDGETCNVVIIIGHGTCAQLWSGTTESVCRLMTLLSGSG